jgi:hypothetical protein
LFRQLGLFCGRAVLAERPQLSHCQSWRISPPSTNSDISCVTKDSPFHCGESYR